MNYFKTLLYSLFFLLSVSIFSQNKIVSGLVVDATGNPIPGVNIIEETQKLSFIH